MSSLQTTETNVPGVELIYLEDQDVAGIHIRGLARLLGCDQKTVQRLTEGVTPQRLLNVEIQTGGGFQGVTFVLEDGVVEILEKLIDGKHKKETKDSARALYRQFARAGFKLYTMLKVAPDRLKVKIDSYVEEVEALKLKRDILKLENDLFDKRHYVVTALPEALQQKVLGYTEVKVVEYRDRILKDDEVLRDGSTIQKTEMCQRLGLMTKTGKPDFKALNHFLENVALPSEAFELKASIRENLELKREYWPQVQEYWTIAERQRWLGE